MKRLYLSGNTIKQIAEKYEVSMTTIRNALLRQKTELRPRNYPRSPDSWKTCPCGTGDRVIYRAGQCSRCYNQIRNSNPTVQDRRFTWKLKYNFNMTREEYDRLLVNQDKVCAICKQKDPRGFRLAVDHDHQCCRNARTCGSCNRELLCVNCNTALGSLGENLEIARNLVNYLKKWSFHS